MPLITLADSLLVVIDLQPRFWGDRLAADDLRRAEEAASRAAWLAATASALGVPALITEEDPERNGPTDEAVLAALRPDAAVFRKPVFGLASCPDIMAAMESTRRRTAVLAGFETDVCVTHSAVGLGEAGYRVVVAEDATYSPFGGARAGNGAAARSGGRARALQGRLLRLGPHPEGRARLRDGPPSARVAAGVLAVMARRPDGGRMPAPARCGRPLWRWRFRRPGELSRHQYLAGQCLRCCGCVMA